MDMARVQEINEEINGDKQLLAQTDYQCLKFSEGEMSEEEYAPTRTFRAKLRGDINRLEAEMKALEEETEGDAAEDGTDAEQVEE